jgi:hypothetical protein
VRASCSGATTSGSNYAVYATTSGSSSGTTANYGAYVAASGTAITNYGVYATASGGTTSNFSGYFADGAELKIPDSGASAPSFVANGMIVTGTSGASGRIRFGINSSVLNVSAFNSDGSGDYSELFRTSDSGLEIGEVIAVDQTAGLSVRRTSRADASRMIGVVSRYGTQNSRYDNLVTDIPLANVALLGQVPVLVSDENGSIRPGDPLTASRLHSGIAVRATRPGRILGHAMTHYPYVAGEITWPDHAGASPKDRLNRPHVMLWLRPGWYEGSESREDDKQ